MTTPALKNGCHNRPPYKQSTELRDHHGRLVSSWPAVMNPACQYTHSQLGQADERCQGCKHRVTKGGSMLMRVQEIVDYSHVPDHHKAIHERLENWRRWVIVRPHGWQTAPMFRMYQSKARQWEAPTLQNPVNTLDAVLVEKAVAALPEKQREAIRWSYVHAGNPVAMAKQLAVSKQGLADLVNSGRTMLKNRIGG